MMQVIRSRLLARRRRIIATLVLGLAAISLHAADNTAQTVGWGVLKTLTASTPEDAQVRQLQGKRVSIPGFMVPLEDDAQEVTEFLLVPYAGACIHVPPPPPNQMVYVQLMHGGKAKMSFTRKEGGPLGYEGKLRASDPVNQGEPEGNQGTEPGHRRDVPDTRALSSLSPNGPTDSQSV